MKRSKMSTSTTILFAVSLIMTLTPINAYVPIRTMGPFVAKSTDLLPIIKFKFTILNATLVNPCLKIENYAMEKEICTREYEGEIIKYLNQQCNSDKAKDETQMNWQSFTNDNHEEKQVAMPVNAIVSYGILGEEQLWGETITGDDMTQIEKQIKAKIEKLKANKAPIENFEAKLMKTVNENWNEQFDQFEIRKLFRSEIQFMKDDLEMLVESLHGKPPKVTNNYENIFKNNPLVTKDIPVSLWTPYECNFTDNNVLSIRFKIPIVHKDAKIVQLDPFKIIATANNNKKCLMKYVGKEHLLVNQRTDCVRNLFEEPSDSTRLVPLVLDNYSECIQHDRSYNNKWETVECDEKIPKLDIIQVKNNDKEIFIYCYGRQLRVEGHESFECKNIIYAIPSDAAFWIDGFMGGMFRPIFPIDLGISSEIFHLINQKMIHPQIGDYKRTIDLNSIIFDEMKINEEIYWKDMMPYQAAFIVLTIIAFLFLVVFICTGWRKKFHTLLECHSFIYS